MINMYLSKVLNQQGKHIVFHLKLTQMDSYIYCKNINQMLNMHHTYIFCKEHKYYHQQLFQVDSLINTAHFDSMYKGKGIGTDDFIFHHLD